jgi:hypothetical protein
MERVKIKLKNGNKTRNVTHWSYRMGGGGREKQDIIPNLTDYYNVLYEYRVPGEAGFGLAGGSLCCLAEARVGRLRGAPRPLRGGHRGGLASGLTHHLCSGAGLHRY